MSQKELDEMLEKINQAVANSNGDPKKESQMLNALIDPADAVACEGCQ